MDLDSEFFRDAKEAVAKAEQEPEKPRGRPWMLIASLLIVLIFILSAVPLYSIHVNPPPDRGAVAQFELTGAEKDKLGEIDYDAMSRIPEATAQVDVHDYRDYCTPSNISLFYAQ